MGDPELDGLLHEMDSELFDIIDRGDEFPTGKVLHHYTNAVGFHGILREKAIRATHFRYLNDSSEMQCGEDCVQEVVKDLASKTTAQGPKAVLETFLELHEKNSITKVTEVFVASFSESENQLSQWRAYAANGSGFSLGITALPPPDSGSDDPAIALGLHRCIYSRQLFEDSVRERVAAVLQLADRIGRRGGGAVPAYKIVQAGVATLLRGMALLVPKLKDRAFSEEQEWRITAMPYPEHLKEAVQFQPAARGLIPFISVPLARNDDLIALERVYVGPTQNPAAGLMAARMYLTTLQYPLADATVALSGIPFIG